MTSRIGEPIKRVVIVGGGTAGWMAGAALARMIASRVNVTLVESDEIGIVGVGEATIPPLRDFNLALGIDENEFLAATQGTFKLGIQFDNWGRKGDSYIHPFGKFRDSVMGIPFHQLWLRQKLMAQHGDDTGEIGDYSLSVSAAKLGRFTQPGGDRSSVLSTLSYAYHIDASLYSRYLRNYATARGVNRIEGKIVSVEQAPLSGNIAAVVLENGQRVEGDFFIDCSGFRSLLLGQTLGVPYQSWQRWLLCDSAIAVPSASAGPPDPYTRSTAEDAGWRWRIPLQHRVGNGHVFSSAMTDSETALQRLLDGLDASPVAEPRHLRFEAGRRERMWEKNCIAIGLSSGFIEPLESTSIHLIQQAVFRILALFPDQGFDPVEVEKYNDLLISEYEFIRDFIILHYKATQRDDSEFWNYCRTMELPDSLEQKLELWRGRGRLFRSSYDLFTDESWIAVLLGQNEMPQAADPIVGAISPEINQRFLLETRMAVAQTAQAMPRHEDYIARYCAASTQ